MWYFDTVALPVSRSTWTENTRSCILAGSSAWRESEVAEIDRNIETKLDEFSKLAAAGQMLMQDESRFKDIVSVWLIYLDLPHGHLKAMSAV